jgi:hypothetical protein
MSDWDEMRSQMRGGIGLAPTQVERFGKLLHTAKGIATPDQWEQVLSEIGLTDMAAEYYIIRRYRS